MKRSYFLSAFFCFALIFQLEAVELSRTEKKDIPYYPESVLIKADNYQKSQCRLDISVPENAKDLPVFIRFHGGGLTSGKKVFPDMLKPTTVILVSVGYRLSPKAQFPAFLEDAAAAVAWTFSNIGKYGGDPKKIFLGGSSAGGYLSAMIGMDPRWLGPYDIDRSRIAGLVVISGQVTTHFNVRKMLKYPEPSHRPIIDENAPLYHVSKDIPPILLVVGDRKLEWPSRVEENEFMASTLRNLKHPHVEYYENRGRDHGNIGSAKETVEQIRNFIQKVVDSP